LSALIKFNTIFDNLAVAYFMGHPVCGSYRRMLAYLGLIFVASKHHMKMSFLAPDFAIYTKIFYSAP